MVECDLIYDDCLDTKVPICGVCGDYMSGVKDVDVVELNEYGKVYRFIVQCYHCEGHPLEYYYMDLDLENRFIVKKGTSERVIKSERVKED